MSIGDAGRTTATLWREIEELLANARVARPLHHAEALLDIARLTAEVHPKPLIARLAEAMEDWDGRLLVAVGDDALAPTLRAGDRLVVDWQLQPDEGDLVIAFASGGLIARAITWQNRHQDSEEQFFNVHVPTQFRQFRLLLFETKPRHLKRCQGKCLP